MALTAGLPPMPPPRSLPSWKREGERGEKDRVHLSQVSDGRSGAQLTALLRACLTRLPHTGQTETQWWESTGNRGGFCHCASRAVWKLPPAPTADRSVLQVNQNKNSSPLAPVICTKNSAQFFTFHASVLSLQPTTLVASSPEQLHKTQWGNCEME